MRRLAIFAGAFSLGIFLAQYLMPPGWLLPGAAAAFGLACGALALPGLWRRRLLLAGAGLSLAFGYNWLCIRQVQRPMEHLADSEQVMTMTLLEEPAATDFGARVTVQPEGLPGKAVYYGEADLLDHSPGETVTGPVRLKSSSVVRDEQLTAFTSRGIFLLAYAQGEDAVWARGTADSPRWWPARLGRAVRTEIRSLFESRTAGFLTAILTGDTSALAEEDDLAMSQAGISHILAVSGMHCTFLVAIVSGVLGRHRRRLVAGTAVPLLAGYALLTGGRSSVVRACLMVAFLLAAPLFRRESDGPTALSAALALILLNNPFAAASVSLQLSFGAVAGILWLTPKLKCLLPGGRRRLTRYIRSGVAASLGALVFTVPLTALYFNTLVLIAPLSNLLVLWAAGGAFASGLAAVAAGFLWPPLGAVLGWIPTLLARYILWMAEGLANLPLHAVSFSSAYLPYWLIFVYGLFLAVWLRKPGRRRPYLLAGVLVAGTLALTLHLGEKRYASGLHICVLDVGQGQSVLLEAEGTFALVDCGSGNSWHDAGQTAADQLVAMGCRTLDYLILTHYDTDHVNGVPGLLARLPAGTLLMPESADPETAAALEQAGPQVRTLQAAERLPLGSRAVLTVYPPVGEGGSNEQGLSVLCSVGDYDLLITGDMDSATERRLLETYPLPDLELLVVGHHGSRSSTSRELLDAVQPEMAVISVGDNRYGHPTDEVLWRLTRAGAEIFRTDMQGTIHITVNEGDHYGIREKGPQGQ